MILDPLKWSVLARRIFGIIVVLISLGSFLLAYLMASEREVIDKSVALGLAISFLAIFSLFWVGTAYKYGYRDAFIMSCYTL